MINIMDYTKLHLKKNVNTALFHVCDPFVYNYCDYIFIRFLITWFLLTFIEPLW